MDDQFNESKKNNAVLRLVTWNINGLRAILQRLQTDLKSLLEDLHADVICFQETKLTRSEMDQDLARPPGFDAYYSFSRKKNGYSGVVTFCKSGVVPVVAAEEGLTGFWPVEDAVGHYGQDHLEFGSKDLANLESEGRVVITDHGAFVLINAYCPALASNDRFQFKMDFHQILLDRVQALQCAGKQVILVGDINVAHRRIDHCDPDACCSEDMTFEQQPFRRWMSSFVVTELAKAPDNQQQVGKLLDIFRCLHPTRSKAFTCWNTVTSARENNFGTRIDYILADPKTIVNSCDIEPERQGSDHCPVQMEFAVRWPSTLLAQDMPSPSLCAKYFVEFAGKQQTLHGFLTETKHQLTNFAVKHVDATSKTFGSLPRVSGVKRKRPLYGSASTQVSIKSFFASKSKVVAASTSHRPTPSVLCRTTPHTREWSQARESEREQDRASVQFQQAADWRQVLSGTAPETPLCWHHEPSVLRVVLKHNSNFGRKFYVCNKPAVV